MSILAKLIAYSLGSGCLDSGHAFACFDELSPLCVAVFQGKFHMFMWPHDSVIFYRLKELGEACIGQHYSGCSLHF